jgi:hypothetical protein
MWRAAMVLVAVSWTVFQGLPMLAGEALPSNPFDLIPNYGLLALISPVAFFAGAAAVRAALGGSMPVERSHETALDGALGFASLYIWVSTPILVPWAALEAWNTVGVGYGYVEAISRPLNVALYVNLSLLPVVLWNRDLLGQRRYWALIFLIVLPRALITLGGGRFFVLQALIPIALWETQRMRRAINFKTVAGGIGILFAMFYGIPALRGDALLGVAGMVAGSPLGFAAAVDTSGVLQTNDRSELVTCSVVVNATGLDPCALRSTFRVPGHVPARLDHATTFHLREMSGFETLGTGGNPVVEAFPKGGISWGLLWFALAGGLLSWSVGRSMTSPVACFLLPHVTAKSLFLWRATLSEIFERIPLILVSYAMVWAMVWLLRRYAAHRVRT